MPVQLEVLTGPWVGRQFYSDRQRFSVGSNVGSDFAIDSSAYPEWSSFQVRFTVTPDGCWAQPSGNGSLFINSMPANGRTKIRLRSGDVFSEGPNGLQLSFAIISHVPSNVGKQVVSAKTDIEISSPLPTPQPKGLSLALTSVPCAVLGAVAAIFFFASDRSDDSNPMTHASAAMHVASSGNDVRPLPVVIDSKLPAVPTREPHSEQRIHDDAPVFSVDNYRESIVWLRGDVDGLELPWCCGWVIGEHHIVTTANSADVLQEVVENGGKTMMFNPANETFCTVTETRLHPVFSESSMTPQTPVSPNLAILTSSALFARTLKPVAARALPSSIIGTKIHAVGYLLPESDQIASDGFAPKPYSRFDAPKLISRTGTVKSTVGGKHLSSDCPLLVLSIEEWPGCDGSAVFDDSGCMIGTLFKHGSQEEAFVVLNDYIDAFSNSSFKVSK